MRLFGWLLAVHVLIYTGLQREGHVLARAAGYPEHLWSLLTGGLTLLLPGLALTGAYLAGTLLLAWWLLPIMRRAPPGALWVLGRVPPFVWTIAVVYVALFSGLRFGFITPVDPLAPWMAFSVLLDLAVPLAGRVALVAQVRTRELIGANFTRTARAMGLSERRVRAGVERNVRPENLGLLAGEAISTAVALVIIAGLLSFPGLGEITYRAFSGVFGGSTGFQRGVLDAYTPLASGASLLLLLLAGAFAVALDRLSARLDPRRHA